MVIFHSYVSSPEGKFSRKLRPFEDRKIWDPDHHSSHCSSPLGDSWCCLHPRTSISPSISHVIYSNYLSLVQSQIHPNPRNSHDISQILYSHDIRMISTLYPHDLPNLNGSAYDMPGAPWAPQVPPGRRSSGFGGHRTRLPGEAAPFQGQNSIKTIIYINSKNLRYMMIDRCQSIWSTSSILDISSTSIMMCTDVDHI